MSDEVYKEIILDHYKNPHNFRQLAEPSFKADDSNPLCGDHIELSVKVADGRVSEVGFIGKGCAISQAAASILTDLIQGKTLDELKGMEKEQLLEAMGNPDLGPVRIKCALLSLKTLKLGLYPYMSARGPTP
ncbi:MAG: SUF system NifU family Fe-S cluster assembly protein [Nitrososphaerota archaeon]|nr:SUF system NifU family Fe-S cluster assembly protein [Nitrososphaerota archaeon]MDG6939096.1 SUF system NifU family Fe-S cluster assembly protein [Nitrososphaerota archaeon]